MCLLHMLLRAVVCIDSVSLDVPMSMDVVVAHMSTCHVMLLCHHMSSCDAASIHHVVHVDMSLCHTHACYSIVSHMCSMCVAV